MKKRISLGLAMALLLSLFLTACGAEPSKKQDLPIYYFHNNACSACNEVQYLWDALAAAEKTDITYHVVEYKIYQAEAKEALAALKNIDSNPSYPLIMVGQRMISGYDAITKEFPSALRDYAKHPKDTLFTIPQGGTPEAPVADRLNYPTVSAETDYGVLFTTESCGDCAKMKEALKEMPFTYEERSITEGDNAERIQGFFEKYRVPESEQKVPILFLRDTYFFGAEAVEKGLATSIEAGDAKNFQYPEELPEKTELSIWATLGTGLVNGLNPCALSMLFLLLSLLVSMKEGVVSRGLSYMGGKFAAYLLVGLGLSLIADSLSLSWLSGLKTAGTILLLCFSLVFAFGNFMDFYQARRENYGKIRLQLPGFLRKLNGQAIEGVAAKHRGWVLIPILFGLGALISAGELLCTGQIYLASILYAAQAGGGVPILHLVLYVSAMCLPSVAAVLLVGCGKRVLDLSEFSRKHLPVIKLINGVLFVAFAILAIFML